MTYRNLLSQIHQLGEEIKKPDHTEASHLLQRQKQYEKWRLMLEYVRLRPFRVSPRQPRSRQWQEAMNKIRELRDQEIIDWLWQQSDISRNHERGIQDVRPPRKGPCHGALVEYLQMRERKAKAILQWEETAQREGCHRINSDFHARTREILKRYKDKGEGTQIDHGLRLDDPWLRS
jgi:hypothetical protein